MTATETKTARDCRYTIEADGPPDGRSTYIECFGPNGKRGRVLYGSDSLEMLYNFMRKIDNNYSLTAPRYPDDPTEATSRRYWLCDRGVVIGYQDYLTLIRRYGAPVSPILDAAGNRV